MSKGLLSNKLIFLLRMNSVYINKSAFVSDSDTNEKPDAVVSNIYTTVEVKNCQEGYSGSNSFFSFGRFIYKFKQINY